MVAMRQAGWICAGVEPNPVAAGFAQSELGLNVVTGDIFAWPAQAQFDLVTLWDVLEHTPSPTAVLRQARALLKPRGWLALSVPNWGSLERRLFGERWIAHDAPRHLYHFAPQPLRALLGRAGFVVRRLQAAAPVHSLASNALRLAGDQLFRRGQAKALASTPAGPAQVSPARRSLIQAAHVLLVPPNAVANLFQRGANLTVMAQPE
jgi:SAM-dependent methyltransferase